MAMASDGAADVSVSLAWRKSSYSGSENQDCVEVAVNFRGVVPVRDSKFELGPQLAFASDDWASFISAIRDEEGL
jgi:hypothetical protein